MENLPDDKVRFFGKVTATVTHELINVLAIIDETSGLMEDILLINRENSRDCDKTIIDKIGRVKKQVKRGSRILHSLNGFSHAPDSTESAFDACDAVKEVLQLTERLMKVKGMEVMMCGLEHGATIHTSPVLFRMAIFEILEVFKEITPEGGTLEISINRADGSVEIVISNVSGAVVPGHGLDQVNRICRAMNASVRTDSSNSVIILTFC